MRWHRGRILQRYEQCIDFAMSPIRALAWAFIGLKSRLRLRRARRGPAGRIQSSPTPPPFPRQRQRGAFPRAAHRRWTPPGAARHLLIASIQTYDYVTTHLCEGELAQLADAHAASPGRAASGSPSAFGREARQGYPMYSVYVYVPLRDSYRCTTGSIPECNLVGT